MAANTSRRSSIPRRLDVELRSRYPYLARDLRDRDAGGGRRVDGGRGGDRGARRTMRLRSCGRRAITHWPNRAMGFCFFNNVAIAAAALIANHGLSARADPRLGRASRQRHPGNVLCVAAGALHVDPSISVLSGHRAVRGSWRGRGRRLTRLTCRCRRRFGDDEYLRVFD